MNQFKLSFSKKCHVVSSYRRLAVFLTLFVLFYANKVCGQGQCSGISYSFEHYEPCKFRARYTNTSECFIEIRYILASGTFSSWNVNSAAGFTVEVISPSELWVHHNQGFVPLGNQVPLLFTLPPDLNTTMNIAYLDNCAMVGCELIGGIPIESCPDPKDASIIGVKYRECGSLPYSNQTTIPGWPIQLLNADGNLIEEQVTDAGGNYAFYDRSKGIYIVKEGGRMGWTPNVPASGQYTVDLAPSQQVERNFGNCPGCSCDSIYMDVVQKPDTSSSSCAYSFSVDNTGAYCFTGFNVSIESDTFASIIPAPGWTVVEIDCQHFTLDPPNNYLLSGHIEPCLWRIVGGANHNITVSTSWNNGGVPVNCARSFSYPCPPPVSPAPCCPVGSTFGAELVLNGNFQLGNQDFTNNYIFFAPGGPTMIGKYSVLNQSQVFPANSQWAGIDHTTFSATGKMLIVDGYNGPIAWQPTLPLNVTAGTTYSYSAWFNNLVRPPKNYADPQMALFVDNTQVAGPLNLPETPDQWIRLCGTWTATTTGPVVLSIRMLSTASIGNDVAIDDISFRACIPPPPCSVTISASPTPFCGTGTLTANAIGAGPFSYQWSHGQSTPSINVQGLTCGTVCSVSVTCADGTVSSASYTVSDNVPPVAICNLGVGVDLGAACSFIVTPAFVDGGSSDDCQIQSLSVSPAILGPCLNTIVTLTVTDWCGNTSTCTMGIQTAEGVPPTITNCPAPITIGGFIGPNGVCTGSLMPPSVTATDNCPGPVTVTNDAPIGGIFPVGTTIVTYTATDACGNTSTCTWPVTVICLPGFCAACPQPSNPGGNLVLNGDFELGNNGQFLSGYPYFQNGFPTQIGFYSVLTSTEVFIANSQWACTDHSTGTQMLIVDGINANSDVAWATVSPITVLPNNNYHFCAFINNIVIPSKDHADPTITVWINNVQVGPTVTLPENPDAWIPIGGVWNSLSQNGATIEIRVGNSSSIGTDFAIDDITFRTCNSIPCTADFNFQYNCNGKFSFNGFANGTPGYTWSWNFGDPNSGANNTSSLQNPMHQFSAPGTYTVTLTITDAAGCVATYSAMITVPPFLSVSITGNTTICAGNCTTLTASGGGINYQWSTSAGGQSIQVCPQTTTTYTVTCTDANGCTTTASVTVTVNSLPMVTAGVDQLICQWQTATLTAFGGGTYQWSPNGSTANPYITAPVQANTTYTVIVTGTNGCTASDQVNVNIKICDCEVNSIVQNPEFNLGNPCIAGHEDICNATSWCGIWTDGPGLSVGDFYNTTTCTPTMTSGSLATPAPAGCGNFGAFWCRPHPAVVWREGIMNTLTPSNIIQQNSGNYMVSMKMACLVGVSGVPRMSVYGVPQGATSTIPVLTGTTPLNTGLFNGAGAILLGKVLVPGTCNNNYTNVGFNFNANILPGPIDRIFLTRDDPVGLDNGGSTFLAVDSFCVKPILDPGTCQCGVLQWATIQQKWTSPQPLSCNGPFIGVPCTKPGSDYFVHGNFTCSPAACGNNTVTWVLDRPAPLPDITGSTSTSPYPHFDISLLAGYFTVSGNYSLTVSRMCGTTPCHCKLNFKIDACPCLCDPDPAFAQSVGLGFSMSSVIFPPTPCKKRFKPISLCPNDMVTWTVPGVGTFTSTGNAPITVTFPSSGTYYVCMIVKRTEPNGTQCTREFCRKVIVTCGIGPLDPVTSFCTDMKVRNAGFNQGMIPGVLNEWGALSDWELAPNPGEGLVFVEDSTGSLDDGHVVLVGRQNNFAGIMQEVNLLPDNFTVIKFEAINYLGAGLPAGTRIELRLQEYPYLYPDLKKQVLLSQAIGDSSGWHRIERTVNLTLDSSLHYLVICLQNDDETRNSIVGLDNLELCSSPVSDAPELGYQSVHIRIYPNPNSGTFSVELPESPKPGMMFRITDLAGRLMQEQKTEPGSIQQTIRTGELPNGLYFLQVVSEGKVLAVEKFVKQ